MATPPHIAPVLGELGDLAPAGYAIALHVRFTTPTYLFQTYPEQWSDIYSASGYVMHDPTVSWAFQNTGTIRWSDLAAADTAGVLTRAAAFGLVYGFTLSLDREGSSSLASFSRADREFDDAEIAAIVTRASDLHDLTADGQSLAPDVRDSLRLMSVRFTHP